MKKVLILFLSLLFISNVWGNEYFDFGKKAYDVGSYGKAKELLELAVKSKPKNKTYRYYYAQSLMQLGYIDEAAEQYQILTLYSPNSSEGMAAAKVLLSLNKYFENKNGEFKLPNEDEQDYLSYILIESTLLKRWAKNPINVYIVDSESKTIAEKAFQTWTDKLNGILTFNYAPTRETADIVITFVECTDILTDFTELLPKTKFESRYINGTVNLKHENNTITHADIIIKEANSKTKEKVNPDLIYATTLHEIGHALGLNGHSENKNDIMYDELLSTNKTISSRDINTLKKIYTMDAENIAEIKNNPATYSMKLEQAKDYVQAHPDIYTAWSRLASAYVAVDDYEHAVEAIQKAIELKGNDTILQTQLAGYYMKLGKNDLAIDTYKFVYDSQPNNKVYLYNWAKACYKNKRAEEARSEVDKYLLGDGFLANDEISRSLRRMYKQDKNKENAKINEMHEQKEKKMQELEEQEMLTE